MIGRAFIRYGGQLLLVLSPLLMAQWSLLDELGLIRQNGNAFVLSAGVLHRAGATKSELELEAATLISLLAFFLVTASEAVDVYVPKRRFEEFRELFLERERKKWVKKLGSQFRLNIMYARRCWYFGFLSRRLLWTWGFGYRLPHERHFDEGVTFHASWFWCQGVCGLAYRRSRPQFADLRSFRPTGFKRWGFNGFSLGPRKVVRTSAVKAVLSIPILDDKGRAVGVLNIDTRSESAVDVLQANEQRLIEYFGNYGKILAKLRG